MTTHPPLPTATPVTGDDAEYARRLATETAYYATQEAVHDLPAIYHYWSSRHLLPMTEALGFTGPEALFAQVVTAAKERAGGRSVRVVSIGCGNCDVEVRLAADLVARGVDDVVIDCLDINPVMLERGERLAAEAGLAARVRPLVGDFNDWQPGGPYDVVIANQSLHHVSRLEHLFAAIARAIGEHGRFVTSDVIGRNGHQRWPEALPLVRSFWRELPRSYRYDLQLRRQHDEFVDCDCAIDGFEGIRAQDILPLLVERFGFELFLGYANVVDPFIDRRFGHHFDPARAADRELIDRIHACDDHALASGAIKPTHLFAVLTNDRQAVPRVWRNLTPAFALRSPDAVPPIPDPDALRAAASRRAGVRRSAAFADGHFYSPVVDTPDLFARAAAIWPPAPEALGIDFAPASHRHVLGELFPRFLPDYDYPEHPDPADPTRFFTRNSQFSWLDCRALFVLLRAWCPRRMVEVGGGYSTLLAADVNRRFLGGTLDLTTIEPNPPPFLRPHLAGLTRLIPERVERVGLAPFAELAAGDLLFIDSSHVAKTGSDVNFLYFDVLPRLPPGVLVHVHDIFLPHEYPREWVLDENRSWNEQYVVRALLQDSSGLRVRFGSSYAMTAFPELVRAALALPGGRAFGGGSLWLERCSVPPRGGPDPSVTTQ